MVKRTGSKEPERMGDQLANGQQSHIQQGGKFVRQLISWHSPASQLR
ncbi:hypothetical protein [Prevotella corporis]|nr:hypothetical protein [Prevotella corporis]MDQ7735843.1 hypothetical protein [Prevotella corporis]